jgi:DNA-binding IclR family transcriptional regulator
LPKIYSQDLVNNLFRHPYTKIEFLMKELQVSKPTAVKYLNALVTNGFLYKQKIWKTNFYINEPLFNLFKKEQDYAKSILNIETVNEKRNV